jgi:hypothetical protein
LLCGPDYILIISPLAEGLRVACGDDVTIRPATIVTKATGEPWSSYIELVPVGALAGPDAYPGLVDRQHVRGTTSTGTCS